MCLKGHFMSSQFTVVNSYIYSGLQRNSSFGHFTSQNYYFVGSFLTSKPCAIPLLDWHQIKGVWRFPKSCSTSLQLKGLQSCASSNFMKNYSKFDKLQFCSPLSYRDVPHIFGSLQPSFIQRQEGKGPFKYYVSIQSGWVG